MRDRAWVRRRSSALAAAAALGLWVGTVAPTTPLTPAPAAAQTLATADAAIPQQNEDPFSLYLPALARSGDGPRPGTATVEDLVSGAAPAVAWSDGHSFATVGRKLVLDAALRPLEDLFWVRLPGPGRAVSALALDRDPSAVAAVVLSAGAPILGRPMVAPGVDLTVVVDGEAVAAISWTGSPPPLDVRTRNGRAYVVTAAPAGNPRWLGSHVYVVDIRDPETPVRKAEMVLHADEVPQDVELVDDTLWMTVAAPGQTKLMGWDLSNPDMPSQVQGLEMAASGRRTMLAGDAGRLFAVTDLGVIEISVGGPQPGLLGPIGPETPCLTRALDVAVAAGATPRQIAVAGVGCLEWRAFIDGAWEVDRSATHERAFDFPASGSPLSVDGSGAVLDAHAAAGGVTNWTGIPPMSMDLPGTAACVGVRNGNFVSVAGDALWLLESDQRPDKGLPRTTAPPARLGFPAPVRCALASSGDRIVVAADDLYTVVDMSDPAHPEAGRASRIPELTGAVAADSRRAYMAAGDNGLLVRPLDPADTIPGGVVRTNGIARDVVSAAGHLFVANGPAGIAVLDATGEALPTVIATLPLAMDATALSYEDGLLAVTLVRSVDSHRWWQGSIALALVDVVSPIKPELQGLLDLPGAQALRPHLWGRSALVPTGDYLHQVDVAVAGRPRLDWTAWEPARSAAAGPGGQILAALGELGLGVVRAP